MFSVDDFRILKQRVEPGTTGVGFTLRPGISISVSDDTAYGRGWEARLHEESTHFMCILTAAQPDGPLAADLRHLVPRAEGGGYNFVPLVDADFERRAAAILVETAAFLVRQKSENAAANQRATDALTALANDAAAMERWDALVHLLVPATDAPRAAKLAKSTRRAFTNPTTFLRRFGMTIVAETVPWRALIDALRKDKLLVEFDWREDHDDLRAGIAKLCAQSQVASPDWSALAISLDASAAEFLNLANRGLTRTEHQLMCMDIESDSFPTVLVATARCEEAIALAATFGQIKRAFA